ncbi:carbohydrate ABC transporter permease [Thermus brockianus]|uniref:carbohydrate ABC transporter permease n=1 Tax=Thermus brockianus TaxID=56956 RepID=UPI001FCBF8B4|nr:sugar ABC transporter permease [Thermus brockianus]
MRDRALAFFLLLPLAFYGLTVLLPVLSTLGLSFYRWDGVGSREWAGWANWIRLFGDEHFYHALRVSFAFTLIAWLVQTPLALALGIYFARKGIFRQVASVFSFLPLLFSSTAVGIIWLYILDPNLGVLYYLPFIRGLNPLAEQVALLTLALVTSWQYIPFHTLLYQAAYQGIPQDLYEAAALDGAEDWDVFWHITLPLLRPTLITSSLIVVVGSLTYFDLIWVMTQGGPGYATTNLPVYLYRLAFQNQEVAYGATVGAFLALLSLLISWGLVGPSGLASRRNS